MEKTTFKKTALKNLVSLLNEGKTQFHVNDICKKKLVSAGYAELGLYDDWEDKLKSGGRYFVTPFSSVVFAFAIGENPESYRITASHTDFPMLKIKSNPELIRKGYMQANVENYGGLIKETWFDRPLGMAGKVVLESGDAFAPKSVLFDSEKPVCIIPSLAPHLRKADKPAEIDIQKEMLPVFGIESKYSKATDTKTDNGDKNWMLSYVAGKLGVDTKDILDFDLYLYNSEEAAELGIEIGIENETDNGFITGPRIDNLSSVAAQLEALTGDGVTFGSCVAVGAFFDNEEIGSRSKQGADSALFGEFLRKLTDELRRNGICVRPGKLMEKAFSISLDVAHALHPNYPEKSDITNEVILGGGVVLKSSASQRYVTDSEAGAVIEKLSRDGDIKLQRQVNRSGMPGGQTLGPIMSSYLPIKSVDMGIPVLAMHSASELAAPADYLELVKLIKVFYEVL
jgi:aspartyl aminopeptidase